MRKNRKLVAILSTAALLAMGASMTSFAEGWEKDDSGSWHYYDADDEMVTDEWKKDGAYWFYLDEDGNMLTDSWVDDEFYVDKDGRMVTNDWVKTEGSDGYDDPEDGDDNWYYFNSKGKKITDDSKKINGRTYYFDEDGKMKTGWQEIDGHAYYLGGEDEGWRAENQWLWLEKSGLSEDEDNTTHGMATLDCNEDDNCDDEGWYWFQASGKTYDEAKKKKVNGRYYMFNEHGQMLYEWIDADTSVTHGSHAQLDGNLNATASNATASNAAIDKMMYYNVVEDGSRGNGWYEMDGAEDVGDDDETSWYYIDDGEVKYADGGAADFATYDDDGPVYVSKIKIDGKYFAFNEKGQMQTGLQYINDEHGFYFFDENGYLKTGRIASVECDDDDYAFYFNTKNGKNGMGQKGEKDDYLYFNGKRLQAEDDNKLFFYDGDVYLVNKKGKIQTAKDGKKFDLENRGVDEEDVMVYTNSAGKVERIESANGNFDYTAADLIDMMIEEVSDLEKVTEDTIVAMPFIQLYDDDIYTYTSIMKTEDGYDAINEGWLYLNNEEQARTELEFIDQTEDADTDEDSDDEGKDSIDKGESNNDVDIIF